MKFIILCDLLEMGERSRGSERIDGEVGGIGSGKKEGGREWEREAEVDILMHWSLCKDQQPQRGQTKPRAYSSIHASRRGGRDPGT